MISYIADMDQSYSKHPNTTSLTLMRAGVIRTGYGWRFKKRFLDQFEILFVTHGKMYIEVEERHYELAENQVLICPPYCKIGSGRPSEQSVHFYWADYRIEKKDGHLREPMYRSINNPLQMEQWMMSMCEICWQDQGNMYVGDAVLLQLLDYLQQDDGLSRSQISLVQKIRAHIDDNLQNHPTVASVARDFGYAPDHLTRLFKAYTGISLSEYLYHRRLDVAKTLLTSSDYTINEIAQYLGYDDPNRFTKFFGYHEKISPLNYRNTHQ